MLRWKWFKLAGISSEPRHDLPPVFLQFNTNDEGIACIVAFAEI